MSRKHFSWLLFVTFLAGAAVLLLPRQTGQEPMAGSDLLMPGLEARVNELSWLRVTASGGQTVATLQQSEGYWTVEESGGYRADWEAVRSLLASLAQARVLEPKTANPEYYDRLGVEDVSLEGAAGVMIEFSEESGLPSVIVGNSARGRSGQYVRLADSADSALIDADLDVPSDRASWLETSIIDIADAEVVDVAIIHPDGEVVKASRVSAEDQNFQLTGIPAGREVTSDWSVNSLAGVLANLSLEEVRLQDDVNWDGSIHLEVLTADGLQVGIELVELPAADPEDQRSEFWMRLQAGLYMTAIGQAVGSDEAAAETRLRADEINDRTRGWAYRIQQFNYGAMTKRMDDLLQAVTE